MGMKATLTLKDHNGDTLFHEVFTAKDQFDYAERYASITTGHAFVSAFSVYYIYVWSLEDGSRIVERVHYRPAVPAVHPFDEPALLKRAAQKKFTAQHLHLLRLLDNYSTPKAATMMDISEPGAKKALERIYYLFTNEGNHCLAPGKFRYRQVIYWLKYGELMAVEEAV